jgi:hypothetical protein
VIDARTCLTSLKDQGLFVGLAGNQPTHAETILRALDLGVDVIGTSGSLDQLPGLVAEHNTERG